MALTDRQIERLTRVGKTGVLLVSLLAVGVAVTLATYDFPQGDDYRGALSDSTLWTFVAQQYRGWSGRWTALTIQRALLSNTPFPAAYPYLILSVMAVCFTGFVAMARLILPADRRTWSDTLFVALVLGALAWSGIVPAGESIYWFTGGVENLLPLALGLLMFWGISGVITSPSRAARWAGLIGLPLLAVVTCGLHEITVFPLGAVLMLGAVPAAKRGGVTGAVWIAVLAATLVGFVIVGVAPGNAAREAAEQIPRRYEVLRSLEAGARIVIRMFGFVLNAKLLALGAIVLTSPLFRPSAAWIAALPRRVRLITPILMFAIPVPIGTAYAWFEGGIDVPGRTRAFVYVVTLVGWVVSLMCLRSLAPPLPQRPRAVIEGGAWLVLAAAMLALGNLPGGVGDLYSRAGPWHEAIARRHAMLTQAGRDGEPTVVMPVLPPPPGTFMNGDSIGFLGWRKTVIPRFYGVKELVNETPP